MARSKKEKNDISPTFFLDVLGHWVTSAAAGAVVGLGLFLLCSGPWGIALGVSTSFSGVMHSALRFFSSSAPSKNKTKQTSHHPIKAKTFSAKIILPRAPVLDSDPLERFISLLYGVDSELLKSSGTDVLFVDAHSPLIAGVQNIRVAGTWGTELHVHYLSLLLDIPYRVVRIPANVRVNALGRVSDLNPGKTDNIQLMGNHYIQLINHGGVHWTTMFGKEPVVGEEENRQYINNPGGGDCLFYAFSLGLARYICHDMRTAKELEVSSVFQAWCKFDPGMRDSNRAKALFALGTVSPRQYNLTVYSYWNIFQHSMRSLVAAYMCHQLKHEGMAVLKAYQNIHANQWDGVKTNGLVNNLFAQNPLYREFNMLYNLDRKAVAQDLAVNIFKDLHQTHPSMAYTNKIHI
jgi:hypothetical protein|tara:strand:- start:20765 stop:21982 length:1218 start_codon:yes stop_codon:yes gene_type:complete